MLIIIHLNGCDDGYIFNDGRDKRGVFAMNMNSFNSCILNQYFTRESNICIRQLFKQRNLKLFLNSKTI